jgi:hypothetical protein
MSDYKWTKTGLVSGNYPADRVHREKFYQVDGGSLNAIWRIRDRLFDESHPLKIDEKRDLAIRLDALLNNFMGPTE